jgi:hypothetical protein
MQSYQDLVDAARSHLLNITADINNASTRLEHIRLTALAQEAENLVTELENFNRGLVYSHEGPHTEAAREDKTVSLFE